MTERHPCFHIELLFFCQLCDAGPSNVAKCSDPPVAHRGQGGHVHALRKMQRTKLKLHGVPLVGVARTREALCESKRVPDPSSLTKERACREKAHDLQRSVETNKRSLCGTLMAPSNLLHGDK